MIKFKVDDFNIEIQKNTYSTYVVITTKGGYSSGYEVNQFLSKDYMHHLTFECLPPNLSSINFNAIRNKVKKLINFD